MLSIILFILCSYYLIVHFIRVRKAVDLSSQALFPTTKQEFSRILLPAVWKEMGNIEKGSRSYRMVKWGTVGAILLMAAFTALTLIEEQPTFSFLTLGYVFFSLIELVKHPGNLYLLEDGFVLHGKFYSYQQVKEWKIERIVRWSELYGLDDRVNNAYKLSVSVKYVLFQPGYVVVEDEETLDKIVQLLNAQSKTKPMIVQTEARTS